jgi:hypothetical protein
MSCTRCGGFMVMDMAYGFWEEKTALPGLQGTRCLNCGNVEDSVIRMNRMIRPTLSKEVRSVEYSVGTGEPVPSRNH